MYVLDDIQLANVVHSSASFHLAMLGLQVNEARVFVSTHQNLKILILGGGGGSDQVLCYSH